jgi:hypothetical protein
MHFAAKEAGGRLDLTVSLGRNGARPVYMRANEEQ